MRITFNKVSTLPSDLDANSFYYVENDQFAESYLTDSQGVAKMIGNTKMIEQVAHEVFLEGIENSLSLIEFVADIEARDTLISTAQKNMLILVLDATADPTVDEGSALYAYDHESTQVYKVAEYESMDITLKWEDIEGKPVSSIAQIDLAVERSHTHSNKKVLDQLTDSSGTLMYKGSPIGLEWKTRNW